MGRIKLFPASSAHPACLPTYTVKAVPAFSSAATYIVRTCIPSRDLPPSTPPATTRTAHSHNAIASVNPRHMHLVHARPGTWSCIVQYIYPCFETGGRHLSSTIPTPRYKQWPWQSAPRGKAERLPRGYRAPDAAFIPETSIHPFLIFNCQSHHTLYGVFCCVQAFKVCERHCPVRA